MPQPLLVWAAINLPGFPRGTVRRVNPEDPYIAEALAAELIVPVESDDR